MRLMKNSWIYILPACLTIIAGCSKEEDTVEVNTVETMDLVITAYQETSPETRTELVDWSHIYWCPADEISVFSAGQSAKFTSLNSVRASSTRFAGSIAVSNQSSDYVWALYPYDANAVFSNNTITTTLPYVQQAVAETFADDLLITVGRSQSPFVLDGTVDSIIGSTGTEVSTLLLDDDSNVTDVATSYGNGIPVSFNLENARKLEMQFMHVCSGLRFTLTKPGIESVTLTANGGETIAGTFTFGLDSNDQPVVQSVSDPHSSITLTPPEGETFQTGKWYYFVTLPVTFSQGVTLTVTTDTMEGSREINSAFSLKRGAFSRATNMDQNIELEEINVEVQVADPTTWVAVDELGRSVLSDQNPSARENRDVLMFYWTWHESRQVATYNNSGQLVGGTFNGSGVPGITDNSVVLSLAPGAANDYFHPYWKYSQVCFWGRPLFDYYRTTDPWVLRKHAEMLADAGVDAVVFDCSNGTFLWWESTVELLRTWTQAMADGVKVPKIVFHLKFLADEDTRTDLRYLYNNLYGQNLYQNLWYYVDGKPLIIGFPESLTSSSSDQVIKNFFTFRRPQADYINGDVGTSSKPYWGWLESRTQHLFNGEEMTVGVSQNATDATRGHCYAFNAPGSYGRSYTRAHGNDLLSGGLSTGVASASFIQGYNFQEQWDNALQADPKYVFVTGWNEWIAGKGTAFPVDPFTNTAPSYYDAPSGNTYTYSPYGIWNGASGPPAFADQYDSERSRDIEPTHFWGDYGDVYYYQLAKNIRQYKGVAPYPNVSHKRTMEIDGDFTGWDQVSPDFKHYRGNTFDRYHYNHTIDGTIYSDYTGRNDIVDARVTRDNQYIYFYVETDDAMTPYTDPAWMRLFINIDRDHTTGWKGYDYCLNYRNPSSTTTGYVSRCSNNAWRWSDAGTFDYRMVGNKMEIRVARATLGVANGAPLDFEFKWSDNMQLYDSNYNVNNTNGTAWVLDFLVSGDCAPGGRFNFHYKDN